MGTRSANRPRVSPGIFRWLGLSISLAGLAALVVMVWRTNPEELLRPLGSAAWEWLGMALLVAMAVEIVKAMRWQALLGAPASRLPHLLGLLLSGRLINALAPARAGDVYRVAYAAGSEGHHVVAAGGSLILEKAADAAALGIIAGLTLGLRAAQGSWLALLFVPPLALAVVIVGRRWSAARVRLQHAARQLRHLRHPALLARVVALTVAGMLLGLIVNLLVLRALDLPISLAYSAIMLLSGYAVGVISAVPGRLGVFELAVAASLIAAGLSAADGLAAAVALHLVMLAALAVGGVAAVLLGLKWRVR